MRLVRATGSALATAGALAAAGCGDDTERVNRERPAATINVTAAVIGGRIRVSPRRFGAGPIRLLITNQTPAARSVTFETQETAGEEGGLIQSTAPINPAGTATLEVNVRKGDYRLSADDRAIRPAAVRVGATRASAQSELMQP